MVHFKKRKEIRLSNSMLFAYEYAKKVLQFLWNNAEYTVNNADIKHTELGNQLQVSIRMTINGQKMGFLSHTLNFIIFSRGQEEYYPSSEQLIRIERLGHKTIELEILQETFKFINTEVEKEFERFHVDKATA